MPSRTRRNTIQCLNLALYSRDCLRELRRATGIEYDVTVESLASDGDAIAGVRCFGAEHRQEPGVEFAFT